MDKAKFADIIDIDDNLVLEVLGEGNLILCPWDVAQGMLIDPPTPKWQEYRARFIAEGRM